MLGRNRSIARRLGVGVAGLGLAAFVSAPAVAEQTHIHATRPPRTAAENPAHIHGHAVHKPPPSFAPQVQDHPAHKGHPTLQPGPQTPSVVLHIRSPHKTHTVQPIVVVQGPPRTRKQHVIVHSSTIVNKAPVTLVKRQPAAATHPVKVSQPPVKISD